MANASYTNKWGQTVDTESTDTGMLPAFDRADPGGSGIVVPNTADTAESVATLRAKQSDGTTDVADSLNLKTPFSPQHGGSSGSTGGFPDVHAT